jgi:hypothetical protein
MKLNAGISHGYKSTLAKQFFNDGFNWGVRYFNRDLPLPPALCDAGAYLVSAGVLGI